MIACGRMWAIMRLPAKYAHGIKSKAGSGWGRGQAGNYLPPQDVSSPSSVCICLCHRHNATQQYFEYCAITTFLMHSNAQYSDMIMYFDVTASGYFMFWYSSIICSANSQWPDGYNLSTSHVTFVPPFTLECTSGTDTPSTGTGTLCCNRRATYHQTKYRGSIYRYTM